MAAVLRTRYDVVVAGLGASGLAAARHLARAGARLAVTDSRHEPPGLAALAAEHPEVPVVAGGLDAELLAGAAEVVVSPGLAPSEPALAAAQAAGARLVGEVELFARAANAPVVAITGSNGKSTVTALTAQLAAALGRDAPAGGNLGTPALELLRTPAPDCYNLELSSFQLETTHTLRPAVATVLNLAPDHLDRHGDAATYAAIKARVYRGAGQAVANADDPAAAALHPEGMVTRWFRASGPLAEGLGVVEQAGEAWLACDGEPLIAAARLPVAGATGRGNALAALALLDALGLDAAAAAAALPAFTGLPHRLEHLGEAGGVAWINDSKATNVAAACAALAAVERPLVLIAGGEGKGADFAPLAEALAGRGRAAVLIGRDAERIEAALAGRLPVYRAGSLERAVPLAAELAQPGEAVLLAPACASHDQFSDFAARGEAFRRCVREVLDG